MAIATHPIETCSFSRGSTEGLLTNTAEHGSTLLGVSIKTARGFHGRTEKVRKSLSPLLWGGGAARELRLHHRSMQQNVIDLTYGRSEDNQGRSYVELNSRVMDIANGTMQGYFVDLIPSCECEVFFIITRPRILG